jgi:hypothetical protein
LNHDFAFPIFDLSFSTVGFFFRIKFFRKYQFPWLAFGSEFITTSIVTTNSFDQIVGVTYIEFVQSFAMQYVSVEHEY